MNTLTSAPKNGVTQEELLLNILAQVKPANFKDLVAKVNKIHLKPRGQDIIVLVIEYVLKLSERSGNKFGRANDCNYMYVGSHWQPIEDKTLSLFLSSFAQKMGADFTKARYYKFQQELLLQFAAIVPVLRTSNGCKSVNLKNGTFEFNSAERVLRPHRHADGFTYELPFTYDPNLSCPLFDKYLSRVLPDVACRNIIAEYVASIFVPSDSLKLEKVLLLYGGGANGKSVLFDIVNAMLGTSNVTNFSLQQLTDNGGYSRAMFSNKLLNYASEISKDLDTTRFKQLASGEPVDARVPHGKPFTVYNYGKLMFNCNDLPTDVEHTEGFFRRFIIIPFKVTIPDNEQDKTLAQRIISTELSGVFNWVLLGMERLLKQQGFSNSTIVADLLRQYKTESDKVKLFLQEQNYKPSSKQYVLSGTLYQSYRGFCQQDGYKAVSEKTFRKRLADDAVNITRHNEGGYKIYLSKEPFVQEVKEVLFATKLL